MDQDAESLFLLQFELPDADCELSAQIFQPPLKEFTCFPLLPPELRDRVWFQSLLGPQVIDLNPIPLGHEDTIKPPRFPQALQICHESRTRALMHYHILYHRPGIRSVQVERKKGKRPTWIGKEWRLVVAIDPEIDNIFLRYKDASASDWNYVLWDFGKQYKEFFHKIRSLEIRDLLWDEEDYASCNWVDGYMWSPLKHFTGLEELHLIAPQTVDDEVDDEINDEAEVGSDTEYDWPGAEDWERCVECFHARFLKYAKKNQLRKIPQIFLHEWRRLQVRTPEESRDDGTVDYEFSNEMKSNAEFISDDISKADSVGEGEEEEEA